jgi:hypothetical protein
MSDFCSKNTETINDGNYMQSYSQTSCLPNGGAGFSAGSISRNGTVDKSTVDNHITALLSTVNAVAPQGLSPTDTNPAGEFADSSARLRTQITSEYCFYYKRYMYILRKLLLTAASSSTTTGDFEIMKANTEMLNSKLNQILQLLQGLVNSRLNTLRNYYGSDTGVNAINQELNKNRADLVEHATILKNQELQIDVRTAMIDYTVEKNSSSRNLLAIYGFMNIVAAGLIYYLYKNTGN